MLPFIEVGPFHISSYQLVYTMAIVLAGWLAVRRVYDPEHPWRWTLEGMAAVIAGGMIGAVLFWQTLRLLERLITGATTHFVGSGSTVFGAISFGTLAGVAYCRWRGVSIGDAFDRGIPAFPLGQGIGRIGCLFAGCCSGRPTESWLGLHLPGSDGVWCPRYPTQLLSSLADFVIFGLLLTIDRRLGGIQGARERGWFPGSLALIWGFLYCCKRFIMEFLRDEKPLVWGPFSWAHLTSALGLVLVLTLWTVNRARFQAPASPAGGAP